MDRSKKELGYLTCNLPIFTLSVSNLWYVIAYPTSSVARLLLAVLSILLFEESKLNKK
jgi:hypothetical protein